MTRERKRKRELIRKHVASLKGDGFEYEIKGVRVLKYKPVGEKGSRQLMGVSTWSSHVSSAES